MHHGRPLLKDHQVTPVSEAPLLPPVASTSSQLPAAGAESPWEGQPSAHPREKPPPHRGPAPPPVGLRPRKPPRQDVALEKQGTRGGLVTRKMKAARTTHLRPRPGACASSPKPASSSRKSCREGVNTEDQWTREGCVQPTHPRHQRRCVRGGVSKKHSQGV